MNCQTRKSFSAMAALFLQSLFKGLVAKSLVFKGKQANSNSIKKQIVHKAHPSYWQGIALLTTFIIVSTIAMTRVTWACTWLEVASYCNCVISVPDPNDESEPSLLMLAGWNDLEKYCDLAGVSLDNRKLRCAEACANTTAPLLNNNSELCKEYGKSFAPSTVSAYSWIDRQANRITRGHTINFPGCIQYCIRKADNTAIWCTAYPPDQKPATLTFTYPPTSISISGTTPICNGTLILTANPPAPQGFKCKWYRNGQLLSSDTQSIIVDQGGQYKVSYTDGFYDLGQSPITNVPQCPQGTVYHDIDNDKQIDAGELLSGVVIEAVPFTSGTSSVFGMTNSDGEYSFSSLPSGKFNIIISDNNDPWSIGGATITQPSIGYYYGVTSSTYSDLDFALRLPASVRGEVWHDKNCNGYRDGEDTVLLTPEMLASPLYPTAKTFVKAKNGSAVFNGAIDSNGKYTVYVNYAGTVEVFVAAYSKNLIGSRWVPTIPHDSVHHNVVIKDDFDTVIGKDFGFCEYYLLTVKKEGSGTVTSSPAGIDCFTTTSCEKYYPPNTLITLTATPDANSFFMGWSNGEKSPTVTVTMNAVKSYTATFTTPTLDKYACITEGTGVGKEFWWSLNGSAPQKTTTAGTPLSPVSASKVAQKFAMDMGLENNGACIDIGNYTLSVSKTDSTAMCEVTATGCQFNPTIKLVPKQQMLTSIRGFLFNDINSNGLQDSGEAYVQGWSITLKSPNGSEVSAVSDANGFYEFTQLSIAGDYSVTVETRPDVTYTTSQAVVRKVDGVNIPMIASFGIKVIEPSILTVSKKGSGVVTGTGITCGTDCSEQYDQGTTVTLTAIASEGYSFSQWLGDCSGTSPTISVTTILRTLFMLR